jgi:hypothetical protein
MNKEIKSSIGLFIIVVFSMAIIIGLTIGVKHMEDNSYLWLYFLIYFVLVIALKLLTLKVKNKYFVSVVKFISFPQDLLLALFVISIPVASVFFHSVIYFFLCILIPITLNGVNDYYNLVSISNENKIFLGLTMTIVVAVTCYKWLLFLIYHMPPFNIKKSEKMKRFRLEELTEYIINKQNIRFVIYLLFFVYLGVYSFKVLEESSFLESSLYDRAVLQSFLCFLAFDRVILNSKNIVLLPSIILKKVAVAFNATDSNDSESK